MKIAVHALDACLTIADLQEAIADYLKKNGYQPCGNISLNDFQDFINTESLVIKAKTLESYEVSEVIYEFPERFFERIGTHVAKMQVLINSISHDQRQSIAKKCMPKISPFSLKLLNYMYNLDGTDKNYVGVKNMTDIKNKFGADAKNIHDVDDLLKAVNKAHGEFAKEFYKILIVALNNNSLRPVISFDDKDGLMKAEIEKFGFSNRSQRTFYTCNIKVVADFFRSNIELDLRKQRNFGKSGFEEIELFKCLYKIN